MLVPLFFYLSLELEEGELPVCDRVRDVIHFRSEVIRKKIAPNSSYCIRGNNVVPYKGNLAFVFNKLSGLEPVIYYFNNETELWTEVRGSPDDGGAATGKHRGFIYIKNNRTEEAEINVGYTTFFNDCDDYYISSDSHDSVALVYNDIGKRHCYFNGINGRQRVNMHSKNSKCNCKGLVYPKKPALVSIYSGNLKFTNDQGSIQFMMYVCEEKHKKSRNLLDVDADEANDGYVSSEVDQEEGKFYSKTQSYDLSLLLGLCIGIPCGLIVIVVSIRIVLATTDCCCEDCSCDCDCDIKPNKYEDQIITDYSYSDDVQENIPEFYLEEECVA